MEILTQSQLKKRGFSLASSCPLCGNDEESIDHLCLNCPKIKGLWQVLFSFSVKSCFTPLSMKEMLEKWFTLPLGKKDSKLWRVVPVCLLWVIWKERNKIIFEDVAFSLDRIKSSFCNSLFSWACVYLRLDISLAGCISHSLISFLRDGKFLFVVFCP